MTHPVDIHVGGVIRQRRSDIGMTQQQLAALIGIKFQQVQKYETGANRVSASRLWDISRALGVPVSFFFEGCAEAIDNAAPLDDVETRELIRKVHLMSDEQRLRLNSLMREQTSAA